MNKPSPSESRMINLIPNLAGAPLNSPPAGQKTKNRYQPSPDDQKLLGETWTMYNPHPPLIHKRRQPLAIFGRAPNNNPSNRGEPLVNPPPPPLGSIPPHGGEHTLNHPWVVSITGEYSYQIWSHYPVQVLGKPNPPPPPHAIPPRGGTPDKIWAPA